ncbi:MAG: hypothetical protein PHE27_05375 [Alphaproteobacteria bacterium]|nr:hypothetical protein [Alphaproteobacteria bacterium]
MSVDLVEHKEKTIREAFSEKAYKTFFPGVVYFENATERLAQQTGMRHPEDEKKDTFKSLMDSPVLLVSGGGIGSFVLTSVLAPASPLVYLGGLMLGGAVGALGGPIVAWNAVGVIGGAFLDAKALCVRAAKAVRPIGDKPVSCLNPRKWEPRK